MTHNPPPPKKKNTVLQKLTVRIVETQKGKL